MWIRNLLKTPKRCNSYVTSPIFYANAEPHIGHAYTAILCDTSYRWSTLKNPDGVHLFSIGTDEHGSKIFRAAQNANKSPQEFCNEVSDKFRNLFQKLNISPTDFIRTTDAKHKEAVQKFWMTLFENGHIYKSKYSGYYSIVDECFLTESEVEQKMVNGKEVTVAKSNSMIVDWIEEENYMFRLSEFRDEIRKWLMNGDIVRPNKFLASALDCLDMHQDLSISRSNQRLSWGIPVPNDANQTIYVWLDALVNYLTVSGYPSTNRKVWPPTCQIIGKDIIKFHLFYWPAFLLAANIPLPPRVFVHGHWLVDNVKMSKSIGNVVNPLEAIDKYTSEGLRYFLLKHGNPSDDSNFSASSCLEAINSDLVNNIGNLLNRSTVAKMNSTGKYPKLSIDEMDRDVKESARDLLLMIEDLKEKCSEMYNEMAYYKVIELLMTVMKESNRVFQLNQPWKQTDDHKLNSILLMSYESLRIVSILLQPIVPKFADFALSRLGVSNEKRGIENASIGGFEGGDLGVDNGVFISRLQK